MNHSRFHAGSQWRKWDLHIHTPASILNNQLGDDWDNYVKKLFKKAIANNIVSTIAGPLFLEERFLYRCHVRPASVPGFGSGPLDAGMGHAFKITKRKDIIPRAGVKITPRGLSQAGNLVHNPVELKKLFKFSCSQRWWDGILPYYLVLCPVLMFHCFLYRTLCFCKG
jgi:hypothetical protein